MAGRPSIMSDYVSVLMRAIEKAQDDPVQLRSLVYDLARVSLGKHVLNNYRLLGSEGLQRHVQDLESAIRQVETRSQNQERITGSDEVQLLEGPAASPDHAVIKVRDAFSDSVFDTPWPDQTAVTVRGAPDSVADDSRGAVQLLRPSEIWEPRFGSGPKVTRTRPDFWWGVQLVSAAFIGVAIYATIVMHSDFFSNTGGVSHASSAAPSIDQASAATAAKNIAAHSDSQLLGFPLPLVYGIYAVSGGKLFELNQLPIRVPDPRVRISAMISDPSSVTVPDGKLSFVIFRRDLVSSAPMEVFVRVVAQVEREMEFHGGGPPTTAHVNGEWAIRSTSYEFRVTPVEDNPAMIILHPQDPQLTLSAGRYALAVAGQGYDFTVAGKVSDAAHCLERTNVVGGMVYSECRNLQ